MIPAGTVMTCESGHEIARVAVPIDVTTEFSPDTFEWFIQKPEAGDPVSSCPACGAAYIRSDMAGGAVAMHTNNGWVSPGDA
jgi:hypothetical protein